MGLTAACEPPSVTEQEYSSSGGGNTKKSKKTDAGKVEEEEGAGSGDGNGDGVGPSPNRTTPRADGGALPDTLPPDGGSAGPPAGNTGVCAASATAQACFQCCETANPQGIQFLQQSFRTCACGGGAGNCAAACGAGGWCAGGAVTAACDQCLAASDACRTQADTSCTGNATCAAMLACDSTSGCSAKP